MRLTTTSGRSIRATRMPAPAVAALTVVALPGIFVLDRATDAAPVQHLYYLPIVLAGMRFGFRGSIVTALTAIALYHAANPHLLTFRYGEADLVQIVLFLAVGMVTAKLALDASRLRRLAMTDDLTGLHNLRSFEARLAALVHGSRQARTGLTLLSLDIDHLKSLNDVHGHLAGAEAVRTVGWLIGDRLPPGAIACRYGGDEFIIALPGASPTSGRQVAESVRRAVHDCAPVLAGRPFPAGTLSASIGVASAACAGSGRLESADDAEVGEWLFRAADAALYRAKASGRNQVHVTAGVADALMSQDWHTA